MNVVERLIREVSTALHLPEEEIQELIDRVLSLHRFNTLQSLSMIQASADWDIIGLPLALRLHIQARLAQPTLSEAPFSEINEAASDVKRRRLDAPEATITDPTSLLTLEDTPFVTKMFTMLPEGVLQMVYGFITKEVSYKVMIQHGSFRKFIHAIRRYALIQSTDEAIEFFWRCNRAELCGKLPLSKSALFWKATGRTGEHCDAKLALHWQL